MGATMKRLQQIFFFILAVACVAAPQAQAGVKVTYFHNDATGTPVAASDEAGEVIWRKVFRPFGSELDDGGAIARDNTIGYTGHRFDSDLDLVYAGARYYDPMIGRFLSMDPVGFQEESVHSFNKYSYGNNNPYKYMDPDGMASWPVNSSKMRTGGVTGFVGYYGNSRRYANGDPKFHGGADILGNKGDSIMAFEGGKVIYAADTGGDAGKMVTIQHTKKENGETVVYRSSYMHLDSINVELNDTVKERQLIGTMGNTGNAVGTPVHLHFQIKYGNNTVNPSSQFSRWDKTKQFFRGIFSRKHVRKVSETDYEKVRPK